MAEASRSRDPTTACREIPSQSSRRRPYPPRAPQRPSRRVGVGTLLPTRGP